MNDNSSGTLHQCPKCYFINSDGLAFCPRCGADLAATGEDAYFAPAAWHGDEYEFPDDGDYYDEGPFEQNRRMIPAAVIMARARCRRVPRVSGHHE